VVLVGVVLLVVVVAGALIYALIRRRAQDDVHSVEHYHRQLHTLEEMRAHPREEANGKTEVAYPASTFKVSSNVRLTEGGPVAPPPVPPPVQAGEEPMRFTEPEAEPLPSASAVRRQERTMEAINHRPRRVAAPLAAVAVVGALVVVLIVAGMHSNAPRTHGRAAATTTTAPAHAHRAAHHPATTTTTTTTAPPAVSAPQSTSAQGATYQVAAASYSLTVSATGGECWVQATTPDGTVLFSNVLYAGQSHTIAATGPLTVVAGAPSSFAATVDGAPVTLPSGAQAPFTLDFAPR
jgi:Tfp pilus assembly protein PilV